MEDVEATVAAAEVDLSQTLTALGIDPGSLVQREDGTIAASPPSRDDVAVDPARVAVLPRLLRSTADEPAPQIELLPERIGEGGMGEIALGVQVSLDREVAVKLLRRDLSGPRIANALLREAQVLGALEHPNIVPVHMLGRSDDDQPLMVMKRVVGTSWSAFIHRDGKLTAPAGVADPLEWNLGILMQVGNALHYAHSKGVVHRDVKPPNVMIGEFGEVYLMDWGLAVAVGDEPRYGLPPASAVRGVEGTPSVMAPEMAAAEGKRIDARTDVYQLGACLHQLLTGAPRHQGETLINAMASAYLSTPYDYGPEVPAELAAIANRAMARDSEDRFASAEQLRLALAEAVRHSTSIRLAREATTKLEHLREIVASSDPEATRDLYNLFAECRFAFREALRDWSDNPAAVAGTQSVLEVMARYELDQGNHRAAAALISELPEASPDLTARLAELKARLLSQERHIVRWKKLEEDVDQSIGSTERSVMMILVGLLFSAIYFVLGYLARNDIFRAEWGTLEVVIIVYAGAIGACELFFRETLRSNAWNRTFLALMWLSAIAGVVYWPLAWKMEIAFPKAIATLLTFYFIVGLAFAVALDRILVFAVIPLLLTAIGATFLPNLCYEMFGLAALGTFSTFAFIWKYLPDDSLRRRGLPRVTDIDRPASSP